MSNATRKPIRYRSITYFDAVRRYGSIREAARKLGVAASAINRQLIQFETDVGMPLFERFANGMKLTAAGAVLPNLLGAMATRYPGVKLTVKSAGSNQIPTIVASGTADVGLAFSLGHH